MFIRKVKSQNSGYSYLLIAVDVFSRMAYVQPIKTKTANQTLEAFKQMHTKVPGLKVVRSDYGTEFRGVFDDYLTSNGIKHFWANNAYKACYAERFIRTLRGRILKYLTYNNTLRYVDSLQDIVNSYNATVHRTIGMAPIEVNNTNSLALRRRLYATQRLSEPKFSFELGDIVRVRQAQTSFVKSSAQQWSDEVYEVVGRVMRDQPTYLLQDMLGDRLNGAYYTDELQKAESGAVKHKKVEKVVRRKKSGNKSSLIIRWKGWPAKFDEPVAQKVYKALKTRRF